MSHFIKYYSIIILLALINCSKDSKSSINSFSTGLIVFNKTIDTVDKRIPIGNRKYISKINERELNKSGIEIINDRIDQNEINQNEKQKNLGFFDNLFKSKRPENQSYKESQRRTSSYNNDQTKEDYPSLNSVPNPPIDKSITQEQISNSNNQSQ